MCRIFTLYITPHILNITVPLSHIHFILYGPLYIVVYLIDWLFLSKIWSLNLYSCYNWVWFYWSLFLFIYLLLCWTIDFQFSSCTIGNIIYSPNTSFTGKFSLVSFNVKHMRKAAITRNTFHGSYLSMKLSLSSSNVIITFHRFWIISSII